MARLYTLGSSGELVEAQEKPFLDETSDMGDFVKKNAKILGDLIIFSEQTISAGRDKRTDLLAINKDGDVLIIELKRILAGPDVLGQVLGYRNYWRQNLEAVKNLWNEFREKPEELEPDFQNYDPRVLLVAPEFEKELLEIVSSERLPIECAEITRYEHEDRIFVVVDRMEPPVAKIGPVVGQREYGWDWYKSERVASSEQVELAQKLCDKAVALAEKNEWKVSPRFNKRYIAFKYGYWNVLSLEFRHARKVALCCNQLNDGSNPPKVGKVKWEWDKHWKFWYTEIEDRNYDIAEIEGALAESYHHAVAT